MKRNRIKEYRVLNKKREDLFWQLIDVSDFDELDAYAAAFSNKARYIRKVRRKDRKWFKMCKVWPTDAQTYLQIYSKNSLKICVAKNWGYPG